MTSREAIRRLSINSGDCLAMEWLHFNNMELIHLMVTRMFGTGPVAEKTEHVLMQRVAKQARSFERHENPEEWFAKCIDTECDRLRNEAIHDNAIRR
jgi:hypothetical protein